MNFRFDSEIEETSFEINVTSLIDVLFVLLLFFMVSTSFTDTHGIPLKLPKSSSGAAMSEKQELDVSVDAQGGIFMAGKPVSIDVLQEKLKELHSRSESPLFIIRGDQASSHGSIVSIMDLARTEGIERIAIATEAKSSAK